MRYLNNRIQSCYCAPMICAFWCQKREFSFSSSGTSLPILTHLAPRGRDQASVAAPLSLISQQRWECWRWRASMICQHHGRGIASCRGDFLRAGTALQSNCNQFGSLVAFNQNSTFSQFKQVPCRTEGFPGERGGTRTLDPMIKSHVLYRLSYALTRRAV